MRPLELESADVLAADDEYALLSVPPVLTTTERAIVEHLASGHCSKEIATRLNRSRATVEFHVRSLFVKLNARSRAHIVARAFDTGILSTGRSIDGSV